MWKGVETEMEETTGDIQCQDKSTPHVLISKTIVCDGPQIKWAEGTGRGHHMDWSKSTGPELEASELLSAFL